MLFGQKKANLRSRSNADAHPVKDKAKPYNYLHRDNDTVAILIHGFTGSPYDMKELADFLYSQGIDVMVARLAGHGTDIDDLIQSNYQDWMESVEAVANEAAASGKRIVLIGYSFGANIALDLARRYPDRFKGIVCLGPSIFWKWRTYYFILYHVFRLFGISKVRKPYVSKYRVEAYESTGNYASFPTNGLGHFRDSVKQVTRKHLREVTVPILIIHSRDDRISHPRSAEYIFDNVGSVYKEMFILKELNHNPLRSENKNKIFQKVTHFIEM